MIYSALFEGDMTQPLPNVGLRVDLGFIPLTSHQQKDPKNQKTKNPDKKRYYLWQLSSRVTFEQSTVYHIHWLGYSLKLGAVLTYLSLSPLTR